MTTRREFIERHFPGLGGFSASPPNGGEPLIEKAVRFYRLPHALDLPIPSYQSEGAAGMDVRAAIPHRWVLAPGCAADVPSGFNIAIPDGYVGLAAARSGNARKYRVSLTNGVGVIDSDYRGEIVVLLTNLGDRPFVIEYGDRICQIVFVRSPQLLAVEDMSPFDHETIRGTNGYGSTGVQ